MADIADIQVAIWSNPDFEALSNNAALLYVWSFSNPLINPAGIYRVSRSKLLDGRLDSDALRRTLDELREAEFLMYSADSWLWVRSHVRNFRSPGPRTLTSIEQTLLKVGRHEITAAFIAEYKARPVVKMPGLGATLDKLIAQGLAEGHQGFTKGSTPHSDAEFQTPSGPSLEGPGQGQGQGPGQGQGQGQEDQDAREHARPAGVHPQLAEVVSVLATVVPPLDPIDPEDMAVNQMLLRAQRAGLDVMDLADNVVATAHRHGQNLGCRVASLLLRAEIDRAQERGTTDLGGLRAASDAARAGASRPAKLDRVTDAERRAAEAEAEADRLDRERGRAA